jgi:phosphatidylserine/phosphatidylglycerophosphate/cardiolipin synthase-like enzyme
MLRKRKPEIPSDRIFDQNKKVKSQLSINELKNKLGSESKISTCLEKEVTKAQIEHLFFPEKKSYDRIMELISSAKQSLDVCMYIFTDPIIADNLFKLMRDRRIEIRILLQDKPDYPNSRIAQERVISKFNNQDLISLRSYARQKKGLMHNKFIVIDRETTITGSLNFTSAACHKNFENMIVISNDGQTALKYIQNFDRIWLQSLKTGIKRVI